MGKVGKKELTDSELCEKMFCKYVTWKRKKDFNELKRLYESIPEDNRRFILHDIDVKDIPIRIILYGTQEIEGWSHYMAAKLMCSETPIINYDQYNLRKDKIRESKIKRFDLLLKDIEEGKKNSTKSLIKYLDSLCEEDRYMVCGLRNITGKEYIEAIENALKELNKL